MGYSKHALYVFILTNLKPNSPPPPPTCPPCIIHTPPPPPSQGPHSWLQHRIVFPLIADTSPAASSSTDRGRSKRILSENYRSKHSRERRRMWMPISLVWQWEKGFIFLWGWSCRRASWHSGDTYPLHRERERDSPELNCSSDPFGAFRGSHLLSWPPSESILWLLFMHNTCCFTSPKWRCRDDFPDHQPPSPHLQISFLTLSPSTVIYGFHLSAVYLRR